MNLKEDSFMITVGILIPLISYIFISYADQYDKNIELNKNLQKDDVIKISKDLEQHKFFLKETKVDSLIGGNIRGSFLLIGGSIYGEVGENKYLNVVYYDDDILIDHIVNVFRITKFDLENIEIVTIPKNETPYFKYVENTFRYCSYGDTECDWRKVDFTLKLGKPRLFLSEGWAILNN